MEYKRENGYKDLGKKELKTIFDFCEDYKSFLDRAKTEREAVTEFEILAKEAGFVSAESKETLKSGDKIYYKNREKNIALVVVGKDEVEDGVNIIASHLDSPRLDLKQNPLYEDQDIAMLKTHYYGGIKKYQWGSSQLALHGVALLKNGEKVELNIGEEDSDPIFVIGDLLPHLDRTVQRDRKADDVLKGEELRVIVGSIPTGKDKDGKDAVKYTVLKKLNDDYGIEEEDFLTAEFEIVPAHKARDIGFDRGLVGAYGQDDRVCAYAAAKAMFAMDKTPKKTAVCFLVDKEEIGSCGSTGLQSQYLEYFLSDLIYKLKGGFNQIALNRCLWNSNALSADVDAGVHPVFKEVHDLQNAAKLSYGLAVVKYTGARGKGGASDADAEYVSQIRRLLNKHKIKWQVSELGKVDEGGGGTVAQYLANRGIKTLDAGVSVIGMHSPFEITSKFDIYESYRAYEAFFVNM